MADKYGIPEGGNNGAWGVKYYQGNQHQLNWKETVASVALGGWPEHLWAEAAAVVGAESSRKPFIYNTYKKGHFGLFQISRSAHADFFKPNGNGINWISPEANAKEGYRIYKSQGWGAWEAHSKGMHLAFLAQAKVAVSQVKAKGTQEMQLRSHYTDATAKAVEKIVAGDSDAGRPGGVLDSITGSVGDAVDAVGDATGIGAAVDVLESAWEALTTPAFWMRIAYGTAGVGLVLGGLFLIVRNSPAGKAAVSTAGKVASVVPAGRAVTAVKGAAGK